MKKNFLAGLLIFLPFAMTILVSFFIIDLLTRPVQSFATSILSFYHVSNQPFWIFSADQMLYFKSKILALIVVFISLGIIGFLGGLLFVNTLLKAGDFIIHRVPVISWIYKGLQELVKIAFNPQKKAFSQVVLVPFPNDKGYSIGFMHEMQNECSKEHPLSIFIPCAPNLSVGYMVAYPYNRLIFIDMPVDEAFKYILSCGIIQANFNSSK